jgi:4-alpha-glucanotransferase
MDISPDQKIAGLLAPLFAIRSKTGLGIGDTQALKGLIDYAQQAGFKLVQLLPVNETGADNSPYMAVSSIALDPTTIHISAKAIRDLTAKEIEAILSEVDIKSLRKGPVKYKLVKPLKRKLLWAAFENFEAKSGKTTRGQEFRQFQEDQRAWLEGYSLFRALMNENGETEQWDIWQESHRDIHRARAWVGTLPAAKKAALEKKIRFYQYVQWIAFGQWRELKAYADSKGVALMGDVPYGVSYYSSDVWANPDEFDLSWSCGAPPEQAFKHDPFIIKWGQNWGVPLYRWEEMRKNGFAWWRQRVHSVREVFHLFRIDHILGFYRIYSFPWRPQLNAEFLPLDDQQAKARTGGRFPHFIPRDDSSHENRESNRREGEEYLKALLEVVGQNRLIGEDLGVVPEYVRPSLASIGIAGFKIPQWEKEHDGRLIPGKAYQRLSVVTYATHDHPPLKAIWDQLFQEACSQNSRSALDQMFAFASWTGLRVPLPQPFTQQIHEGLLKGLFESNSWIAIVMITDLFGETQRFNLPGAIADSNWSERMEGTPADWSKNPDRAALVDQIKQLIKNSGRLT